MARGEDTAGHPNRVVIRDQVDSEWERKYPRLTNMGVVPANDLPNVTTSRMDRSSTPMSSQFGAPQAKDRIASPGDPPLPKGYTRYGNTTRRVRSYRD